MLDSVFYSQMYDMPIEQTNQHWHETGYLQKRVCSKQHFYREYPNFKWRDHLIKHRADRDHNLPDWELIAIKHFLHMPRSNPQTADFDPEYYMDTYPDVVQAGYNTPALAHQHWMMFGKNEQRFGCSTQQPTTTPDIIVSYNNMLKLFRSTKRGEQNVFHVCAPYQPKFENDHKRVLFALNTMVKAARDTKHNVCFVDHYDVNDDMPIMHEIFETGVEMCVRDDDVVVFTNFDICLTDCCYDRVVESCMQHGCTFSFRRDHIGPLNKALSREEMIKQTRWYVGADLFAFTKKWWQENCDTLPRGQLLGRPTWDWVMRLQMGRSYVGESVWIDELEEQSKCVETPSVIYHEKHDSLWERPGNHKLPSNVRNVAIAYDWMNKQSKRNFTHKSVMEQEYGPELLSTYIDNYIPGSVAIVGITRNNEQQLIRGVENMIDIGSLFDRFKIFLYENDSIDHTKNILHEFKQQYEKVFEYKCGSSPNLPGKYQQMGHARQQCVNWVRQLHQVYDHVIVMDPDIRIPVDRAGVIDTFKNKQPDSWDAVFANGIYNTQGMMWDSFAFRTATYGHVFTPDLFESNKLHEKDGTGRILPKDRWTPVHSAFGGLGIYKRECFEVGNYDLKVNDCEHVGFHQSLRTKGLNKLFVNPRMIKKYSTDETNLSGYSTQGVFYA